MQGDFSDKRIAQALNVLIAAGVISALLGIAQFLNHAGGSRATGTFGMYMTYAGILSMIWALAVNQFARPSLKWSARALYLVAVVVILAGLSITTTRMALLAVMGAAAFLLLIKFPRSFWAMVVLVVLILAVVPHSRQAVVTLFWGDQTPTLDTNRMLPWADQRPFLWKGAYRIIKDHPWSGVGLGNFRLAYKNYLPYELQKTYNHAHNNFLQLGAETGLPGLAAFIVLNIAILVFLLKSYFRVSEEARKTWIGGVLCAFVGFHLAGLFEYNFGDSEVAMLFWLLVGFAAVAARQIRPEPAR